LNSLTTTDLSLKEAASDRVLQEMWRAKDTLSAQYGHDLDKLFAETRQREKLSGHPLVSLRRSRRTPANGNPKKA
jgi:hypothetical protein